MKRCVIDTNVLITANKAARLNMNDDVLNYPHLIEACIKTLQKIRDKGIYVVLDVGDEIFAEYIKHLSFSGQPGLGDSFFKWLYTARWSFPDSERIRLHKSKSGYVEFPSAMESAGVDPSDKKFFAVANAHPAKPDILEAVDADWWKWVDAAKQCGIRIRFMDEQYMRDHNS